MGLIKLHYKFGRTVGKLGFLVWFLIPFIPIALLWNWLSPIGFIQSVIMLLVCIFLYMLFLVAEFMLFYILFE